MAEINLMFQPVKKYCRKSVATCAQEDSILKVAAEMSEQGISSMVVCEGAQPVGILTDRDLRNKVVAKGLDPATVTAADIMNTPLITIGEDDFIFEALYLMKLLEGLIELSLTDQEASEATSNLQVSRVLPNELLVNFDCLVLPLL